MSCTPVTNILFFRFVVLCFATVGLLICPDVSLFNFNCLDSSKKHEYSVAIKEAYRTGCGYENVWLKTGRWGGGAGFLFMH